MKNKIENTLKASKLKTWKAFAELLEKDSSNFKRTMFQNIDKINGWLKELELELYVKKID